MPRYASVSTSLALLAGAGMLAGCGDSKAANKDAFRAALEPVVRDVFCSPIDVMSYDVEGQDGTAIFPIVTSPKREIAGPGSDGRSVAMLDAAASAGLVTRTTFEKPARWKGSDRPFVRQQLIAYAPTGKGVPYLRGVERKATDRTVTVPSFCSAKAEVVDVVRWSDPMDLAGHRVSRVTYSYRGVDPVPVMPEEERTRIAEPREATVAFELQSDGWRTMPR